MYSSEIIVKPLLSSGFISIVLSPAFARHAGTSPGRHVGNDAAAGSETFQLPSVEEFSDIVAGNDDCPFFRVLLK